MFTAENPVPNIAELDALLAWAEAEHEKQQKGLPSEWDQGSWAKVAPQVACGSACCIAGKAVARAGGVFLLPVGPRPGRTTTDFAEMPNGREVYISDEAEDLLGLNSDQADALFEQDNTIEDVRRIIAEIKEGETSPLSGIEYREQDDEDDDGYRY